MNIRNLFGSFAPRLDQDRAAADPLFNRREAGWHAAGGALQGLGIGLMTGDWDRAMAVNNSAVDDYRAKKREEFAARDMMEQAAENKRKRDEEAAAREQRNQWLKSISDENTRTMLEANPQLIDEYVMATNPVFQKPEEPKRYSVGGALVDADGNIIYQGENTDSNGILNQIQERQMGAEAMGLSPDDPAYQAYVLTGKMPREDQAPLTATDKKAILEADDAVLANTAVIEQLTSVITPDASGKSLNDRAGSGMFAGVQSFAARNDPTGFFDDATGQATTELQNIVLGQALSSLKSIFGAAPTEGERKILVDLQASIDKTPAERKSIIERAIRMAKARLKFNQDRAAMLRGGSYYKSGGGPATTADGITIELVEE